MFEGSEKKLEIVFSQNSHCLRSLREGFWKSVVKACGATIISKQKFQHVDSYILSESSMFVWSHRLVLITCGKTSLAHSLLKVLNSMALDNIETVFFQRKNEFFPRDQKSHFSKDVNIIKKKINNSVSLQFGPLHDHHFFLFYTPTNYKALEKDCTLEILMHDSKLISDTSQQTISALLKHLERSLPGFEAQTHFFKPDGCSINAIRENFYYTIHITPQEHFFYISFETNFDSCSSQYFIDKILQIFQSSYFDLILFQNQGEAPFHYENSDFSRRNFYHQVLDCGYQVSYMNLNKSQNNPKIPRSLT